MKINWKLFLGAILFIITEGFIFIDLKSTSISDKIQAGSIIALVFVTLYYAIQTYMLVKEAKKKREADFWERRIKELYLPFLDKVKKYLEIFWTPDNLRRKTTLKMEISRLISAKGHMIPKITKEKILELSDLFLKIESTPTPEFIKTTSESLKKAVKIIDDEKKRLEDKLRKFYEVEKKNNENIKKRKKS